MDDSTQQPQPAPNGDEATNSERQRPEWQFSGKRGNSVHAHEASKSPGAPPTLPPSVLNTARALHQSQATAAAKTLTTPLSPPDKPAPVKQPAPMQQSSPAEQPGTNDQPQGRETASQQPAPTLAAAPDEAADAAPEPAAKPKRQLSKAEQKRRTKALKKIHKRKAQQKARENRKGDQESESKKSWWPLKSKPTEESTEIPVAETETETTMPQPAPVVEPTIEAAPVAEPPVAEPSVAETPVAQQPEQPAPAAPAAEAPTAQPAPAAEAPSTPPQPTPVSQEESAPAEVRDLDSDEVAEPRFVVTNAHANKPHVATLSENEGQTATAETSQVWSAERSDISLIDLLGPYAGLDDASTASWSLTNFSPFTPLTPAAPESPAASAAVATSTPQVVAIQAEPVTMTPSNDPARTQLPKAAPEPSADPDPIFTPESPVTMVDPAPASMAAPLPMPTKIPATVSAAANDDPSIRARIRQRRARLDAIAESMADLGASDTHESTPSHQNT